MVLLVLILKAKQKQKPQHHHLPIYLYFCLSYKASVCTAACWFSDCLACSSLDSPFHLPVKLSFQQPSISLVIRSGRTLKEINWIHRAISHCPVSVNQQLCKSKRKSVALKKPLIKMRDNSGTFVTAGCAMQADHVTGTGTNIFQEASSEWRQFPTEMYIWMTNKE